MIKLDVKGLKEINANLKRLTGRQAKGIMRSATLAATNVFKKAAIANMGGAHKKKVGVEASRSQSSDVSFVYKTAPLKAHWPLYFLEFGVPPHEITPKNKKALADVLGGTFVVKKIQHPGVRKVAMFRRAFDSEVENAEKEFIRKSWQRIEKELLK